MAYALALPLSERLNRPATRTDPDGSIRRDGTDAIRGEIRSLIAAVKRTYAKLGAAELAEDARKVSARAGSMKWAAGEHERSRRTYPFIGENDVKIDKKTGRAVGAEPLGPRRR